MKSTHNRLVCLFLAAILLLGYIPSGALVVRADDYPNTYANTGNQRQDIIGVALTQVGYTEGSGGYTKYGEWYGSSKMAWCGAFVSWCANQAGIPNSVIKKNGFANAKAFGLSSFTVSTRLPQPGDLFFKNDGSHTGIVYKVEGNYFYTLEGNTWTSANPQHGVYIRQRSLSGSFYFASPNYQDNSGSSSHNYVKGTESAHPHKEYYKCADCGSMYYTGGYGTVSDCKECQQANCSHSYGSYTKVNDKTHSATCTKCGKQSTLNHTWKDDQIIKEATCEKSGTKNQKCQQCSATREVTVPQTNQHRYSDWVRLDEDTHVRICEDCGREQKEAHKKSTRQSDLFEHWYECEVCGDRAGNEAHTFSGDCESACTVCDYVSATGHVFGCQLMHDNGYHWLECENCQAAAEKQQHSFENDCDSVCDDCGYVRQVTHVYGEAWESNETGHWRRCEKCGQAEPAQPHVLGTGATEETGQCCKTCGYEAVPALVHVHNYAPMQYDEDGHWGTCQCLEEMPKQKHIWNMDTKMCEICGCPLPEVKEDTYLWFIALGAVALVLLLILTAVIVAAVKRRMIRAAARAAFRAWNEDETESQTEEEAAEESEEAAEEAEEEPEEDTEGELQPV